MNIITTRLWFICVTRGGWEEEKKHKLQSEEKCNFMFRIIGFHFLAQESLFFRLGCWRIINSNRSYPGYCCKLRHFYSNQIIHVSQITRFNWPFKSESGSKTLWFEEEERISFRWLSFNHGPHYNQANCKSNCNSLSRCLGHLSVRLSLPPPHRDHPANILPLIQFDVPINDKFQQQIRVFYLPVKHTDTKVWAWVRMCGFSQPHGTLRRMWST